MNQDHRRRLVLVLVTFADLRGAHAGHQPECQDQEQQHTDIPAHQHTAERCPLGWQQKEQDDGHAGGDQQPQVTRDEFSHLTSGLLAWRVATFAQRTFRVKTRTTATTHDSTEKAGTKMPKVTAAGVISVMLLLASSTWASDAPCTPADATTESANICIYNVGKKPAFVSLNVVVNGAVQGKLVNKRPWLLVSVRPGTNLVGIDFGSAPHVRRKVETVAGQVTYLRYVSTTSMKAGFFDMTTEAQSLLQEVTASDALADFNQLPGKRGARRSRS